MANNIGRICCDCLMNLTKSCIRYQCEKCGRMLCESCVQANGSFGVVVLGDSNSNAEAGFDMKSCKFCSDIRIRNKLGRRYSEKIHPSDSPRQSPEPPSPSSCGKRFSERLDVCSLHSAARGSVTSCTSNPSSVLDCHSPSRSDEDEGEDPSKHFFSSYCSDISDVDSGSVSVGHEFYSFKSVESSPSDSPSRIHFTSDGVGCSVQQEQRGTSRSHIDGPFYKESLAILERPDIGTDDTSERADDLSIFQDQCKKLPKPLDFENNGLIWFPPPPDDENDEREDNFSYYDEDYEVGESSAIFSSSGSLTNMLLEKEKQNGDHKEPLRAVVQGHFRALVSQLLHGEGIKVGKENSQDDWLDVVTTISWQAANFVKPDTSRGGSMDPGDYVKVKCIASGSPSESTFVKGIVCTKNIKHKRMTSQYRNTKLLILGGALEYQRVPNQLASLDTLLQQEIDHLKIIVSKIEAHRPNVLLVEKSVSSYAQEYLLAKEISLVLNVKRPLLERIARCTGAPITPSVDKFSTTQLGHCELFRLEKVSEELEAANQFNKKPSKTLMFFEGCPRRLGCTVLLKGSCREELKKVKHVVQYAVFAAYHLSLETSFLADEGASIPKLTVRPSSAVLQRTTADGTISVSPTSVDPTSYPEVADLPCFNAESAGINLELGERVSVVEAFNPRCISSPTSVEYRIGNLRSDALTDGLATSFAPEEYKPVPALFPTENVNCDQEESLGTIDHIQRQQGELPDLKKLEEVYQIDASSEYYSATDSHQSILVSFSSRCVLNGTVCERSRLLRIQFYGCFDKPLGRYLQDDLFDQTSCCQSCKEPAEAHVLCYTHQQGNLTINVRHLPSVKLPGERDGKIWMWHRCLRCEHVNEVPPATRRVVMSDAAWGLSFGKFLELSFSNHATANRVAGCGHSLQKDCLRYYGIGSMVAFFRYSPIDILSVCLPPSELEFIPHAQQGWLRKEAAELLSKSEALYEEISGALQSIEQKSLSGHELSARNELHNHIMELKEQLIIERNNYNYLLQPASKETLELDQVAVDIFELNRLKHELVVGSYDWDHRLCTLDSLLSSNTARDAASYSEFKDWRSVSSVKDSLACGHEDNVSEFSNFQEFPPKNLQSEFKNDNEVEIHSDGEAAVNKTSLERVPSAASELSDKIDSAWTGTDHFPLRTQLLQLKKADGPEAASLAQVNKIDNTPSRRLSLSPARVYSFDSATRIQERIRKGLSPSSLHLSTLPSFHASGDYRNMIRDPISNVQRTSSQILPREAQKFNHWRTTRSLISSASLLSEGARLLLPQNGQSNLVIGVYDSDPTSIISYALSSKEYKDWITDKPNNGFVGALKAADLKIETSVSSTFSAWQSFGSLDMDYIHYGSYGSEDASTATDANSSPHLRISFEDESSNVGGKVKFSVTCYFSKQFDALRKKYGCREVDFVHSLSRCRRWSAQGGKSNVYFAKSLDERFIIKQVTKTELESFEEFAPEYFKYMTDSLDSGSPTCLAKVLGIFQVTVKHFKGGKETKMDIMVMENLFFKRNVSRVYDLKGSARSRYNSDTTGSNKVLLDMNLLEALRTKPMFLGSKAKRSLERAVWNDTSFLASVDVMDYSLLVGVDEERKELVLGIIDFMRQYTWDKHLETWVKASGILGGPKNASPTIISPKQYKKRFRKAMTTYFLTVPDQWLA